MKLPKSPSRTTTGFAFSILERAIRESFAERDFSNSEKESILAFFNPDEPECVFCGSRDVGRWDHLVPVRNGGDTILGNMVLSCSRCDDSKQHYDFEEWMRGNSQYSPTSLGVEDLEERIEKIKAYAKEYSYSPKSINKRLNKKERERLEKIMAVLQTARKDLEELSNDVRKRKGMKKIY